VISAARWARIGFALLAWVLLATTVVQVYLAGQGVFVTNGNFELHRNVGWGISALALVLLVLGFAGRLGWRMIGASALLVGLMVLQSVLIFMRTDQPNIAALHPVNGFLIVVVALWLAWRGLGYVRAPLPPEPARPAPAPASPPASQSGKPDPQDEG
jgi:hypothetical protein